jgi:hypothetical protein
VLPETVERTDHPWFIGVQYHPELKSRPFEPHPLFAGFIAAAVVQSRLVCFGRDGAGRFRNHGAHLQALERLTGAAADAGLHAGQRAAVDEGVTFDLAA